MQKLHFIVEINASKEKVWDTMLADQTYREWTLVFNPSGSYFKGDWSQGSKMLFVGTDPKTGKEGGMVSRVAENKPYEFLSIEHVGIMNEGIEDTTSEEAKKWTPSFENYTFSEKDGVTTVTVDMDSAEVMAEEFSKMWPQGLQKLKELAEK
ncbi:MAG: SRPBCC domain-containing protein [Candidatus Doudnabacteria bacterium]|nr:SRPBCC domain-containing protein [Candidatus Doudnabacteria bacterium]